MADTRQGVPLVAASAFVDLDRFARTLCMAGLPEFEDN
jgi:hypothetical protein